MANHKSAVKRHKQSLRRALRNRTVKTKIKNAVKSVRVSLKTAEVEEAKIILQQATSTLDKAASKGVIHWKKAARKISRLHKAINAKVA